MHPRGRRSHCVGTKRGINYPKNLEERVRSRSEEDQEAERQEVVPADHLLEAYRP